MYMKKIICLILSMVLGLACVSALAETADPETTGKITLGNININGAFTLQCGLPEGYEIQVLTVRSDRLIANLISEDPEKPIMVLSVAFDEAYADVDRMNDLDEEALKVLENSFTANDPTVELSYGDTGLGTRLLIAMQNVTEPNYIDFLSVYKGYVVEFVMTPAPTASVSTLSADQMRTCIDFLTDLDFIPAGEAMAAGPADFAGQTVIANLSGYNPDTNTFQAAVRHALTVDTETAASLKVGDTLTVGQLDISIKNLEVLEDGTILINDEYSLNPDGDKARLYFYDAEYLEDLAVLTLEVPENLEFLDGIDPETGEFLMEDVQRTRDDFISILSGNVEMDPGFAVDNVKITFGEEGELLRIERFYVPWQ